jgi:uncharacterized membrane protein (UPF0127 family)
MIVSFTHGLRMKHLISIFASLLFSLLPLPALAVESPITYARGDILIEGKGTPLMFNAEIRDAENAARSPGWFNYAVPDAKKAAMLTHVRPAIARVTSADGYAPVDVLFVDMYGNIREIMPSIVPAELTEPIASREPVLAVIYLKSGTVASANIRPGDHVSHAIFAKKPVILTEENTPAEAPTAALPDAATPPVASATDGASITAIFPTDATKPLVPAGKKTGELMVFAPPSTVPVTSDKPAIAATAPVGNPQPAGAAQAAAPSTTPPAGPTPEQEKEAMEKRDILVERVLRQPSQQINPPQP